MQHMWFTDCVEHIVTAEGASCRIGQRCYWCGSIQTEAPEQCPVEIKIYPTRRPDVPFSLLPEEIHL